MSYLRGCQKITINKKKKSMKEVSAQELMQLKDSGEDYQLIDVREPYEYESTNLGGELIPLSDILQNADKIARDKKVVIHCLSGARSGSAIGALEQKFGFDNLYNLRGGIMAFG